MKTNQFKDPSEKVEQIFENVINTHFRDLSDVQFKIAINTKKKKHNGRLVLGEIKPAKDLENFLANDDIAYIVFLDEKLVEYLPDIDIERVIRHELRHVVVVNEEKFRTRPHDFEDFEVEVELNKDDPTWKSRVAVHVDDLYEAEKEDRDDDRYDE